MLAFVKAADTRQNASLAVRVNENKLKAAERRAAKLQPEPAEEEYEDFIENLDRELQEDYSEPLPEFREPARREYVEPRPEYRETARHEYREPPRPEFREPPRKAHPKAVRYTEISDDDFFDAFGNDNVNKPERDRDKPVSLEDIFGDDGIFGDRK